MKQNNYENVTIENIQNLYKTGYITEITFDADNKKIRIKEDEYLKIESVFNQLIESMKPVVDAIVEVGKKMINTFNSIFQNLNIYLNKKMTKKKFIKLLQSEGIQRNTINEIVKGNKEPYTYMRYYRTLQNLKR